MKKNTSWKFTDELSVTFQLSVSGASEFGPNISDGKFENVSLIFISLSDPLSEEA